MEQISNTVQQNTTSDVIDLRELFAVLKKRKILIGLITAFITLLAVAYALTATKWWQTNTTIEIGKYMDIAAGKEIYIKEGSVVVERLKIKYIDILKDKKNRDEMIKSIIVSQEHSQFIYITALGKSNELALAETQKVITELQEKHKKFIDQILANKKSILTKIDRDIFQIKHSKMQEVIDEIDYNNKVGLPAISQKIITVQTNLQKYITQKDEAIKNLVSIQGDASLAALRLMEIQGLEYKISENKINLIDFNTEKLDISSNILPSLARDLETLKDEDLAELIEKKKLAELSLQPYNYHNTDIVGEVIANDYPIKPKKKLIVIVAFITGLMLSVFLAFFLEFIGNMRKEEKEN